MTAYFVTSTGTDIGKTFVTAGLIRYLRGSGQSIDALKPVVSGYDSSVVETSDPAVLPGALGKPVSADEIERIAPWRFRAPLSPDLAAAREGRSIDFDQLIGFSRAAIDATTGILFIEGVGGIMVPLDIIQDKGVDVVATIYSTIRTIVRLMDIRRRPPHRSADHLRIRRSKSHTSMNRIG